MGKPGGKHRRGGVKREHHLIPGLDSVLEDLARHPLVASIIPGRIRVGKARTASLIVRVQAPTPTGHKLGARTGTLVQEVFVVGPDPAALGEYLRGRFGNEP